MLSSRKLTQLAAVAAVTALLGATAVPNTATAAKSDQQAQSGDRDGKNVSKARASKKHVTQRHVTKRHVTKKTVVRKKTIVRTHVRPSHRYTRNRVVIRTTAVYVPLVVLGPRVVYRSYGAGWCRALHRGRHWAPVLGWHSGRHVGRVRC